MATEVRVETTQVELEQHGRVECRVVIDGKTHGQLSIGKRGVDWLPGKAKKQRYELSWEKFGAMMEQEGKRTTR
jgi:hypothetical protein